MPRAIEDPILAYTAAEGEINQIQWGATQPDWIAICYNKNLEILRVWFLLVFQSFVNIQRALWGRTCIHELAGHVVYFYLLSFMIVIYKLVPISTNYVCSLWVIIYENFRFEVA